MVPIVIFHSTKWHLTYVIMPLDYIPFCKYLQFSYKFGITQDFEEYYCLGHTPRDCDLIHLTYGWGMRIF